MKKSILLLSFVFILIFVASCSSTNSSSSNVILDKLQERKHTINQKLSTEDGFFNKFKEEVVNENQLKHLALNEKEEIPNEFFDRSLNLVFFGDSLTQGVGDQTNSGGYVPFIKDYYEEKSYIDNVAIKNLGVRGNRTDHLQRRLNSDEVKQSLTEADVIFITIGGNDLMKVVRENFLSLTFPLFDKEQTLYGERFTDVLGTIREHNEVSPIYVIGIFNPFYQFFQEIHEMNEVVTNWNNVSATVLANYENTHFISIDDIFLDPTQHLLDDDQFHPNEIGYSLIGERVVEAIDQQYKKLAFDEPVEE
ncbi:SGNH/GDSL hydrolase family protein [Bacillus sp. FJAT-45066]|uniref:SGNH/GDSL hydrolase family protein n=1 Tax=Bacillus sp. FJAT-45066 TaxID=2011010 RepID=UPI000BB8F51A|nr:SGNH/GDSL hydrolase family protein [Bacillus sp. FJAT-45066]